MLFAIDPRTLHRTPAVIQNFCVSCNLNLSLPRLVQSWWVSLDLPFAKVGLSCIFHLSFDRSQNLPKFISLSWILPYSNLFKTPGWFALFVPPFTEAHPIHSYPSSLCPTCDTASCAVTEREGPAYVRYDKNGLSLRPGNHTEKF